MAISEKLLAILVCPSSHLRLVECDEGLSEKLLLSLEQGELTPQGSMDWRLDEITGFLKTEDGAYAYPVVSGVPNLLPASRIPLGG